MQVAGLSAMAVTLEFPYHRAGKEPVTIQAARQFGQDMAKAIFSYVRALSAD